MHISSKDVALLVAEAGGELIGKTRLQKAGYILARAGLGYGFQFTYHHYGPYSEELSRSADYAVALGEVTAECKPTSWGGEYFVYKSKGDVADKNEDRTKLLALIKDVNAVELELAATAIFLKAEGFDQPWEELVERKPEKASQANLSAAKKLCANLARLQVPKPFPDI